jgi:Protein of unknown function (DUF732)
MTAKVLDSARMDETQSSELADAALTEVHTRAAQHPDLAWSAADDAAEPAKFIGPSRITVLLWAYVVAAALAVAVLVGVWFFIHQPTESAPAAAAQNETVLPSPPNVVVPSAPTVPSAAPVVPPPYTAADDQRFLHRLKELGATLYKPQLVLETAHMTCDQFRAGKTTQQVQAELITALGGVTEDTAAQFASSATMTYPDCG